ncbi:ABC-type antimicrobial peptide transport system, ATPase component [Opitutaceae bacterium TAV1]|nr:ABC-type antimicrobial peptide transport system, ATPase component [Opitutaceae bacterium TAV1]
MTAILKSEIPDLKFLPPSRAEAGPVVIETRGLTKRFGHVTALDNVSLTIRQGEFIAFMGASGSGKTTLMNILTCLDTATEGKILLDGVDAAALDDEGRRVFRAEKIGLIFQQFHLIPYLSALENLMLAQHYHSMVDEAAARAVLDKVGLGHRVTHLPHQLSGGEQQRVCIARALVNEPHFIFADEPTGNLDEENERIVLGLLRDLHRQGRTIIMVTHNPDLICHVDRVVRLHHGKVISDSPTCAANCPILPHPSGSPASRLA